MSECLTSPIVLTPWEKPICPLWDQEYWGGTFTTGGGERLGKRQIIYQRVFKDVVPADHIFNFRQEACLWSAKTTLGSQRMGHDWATEHACTWTSQNSLKFSFRYSPFLCVAFLNETDVWDSNISLDVGVSSMKFWKLGDREATWALKYIWTALHWVHNTGRC